MEKKEEGASLAEVSSGGAELTNSDRGQAGQRSLAAMGSDAPEIDWQPLAKTVRSRLEVDMVQGLPVCAGGSNRLWRRRKRRHHEGHQESVKRALADPRRHVRATQRAFSNRSSRDATTTQSSRVPPPEGESLEDSEAAAQSTRSALGLANQAPLQHLHRRDWRRQQRRCCRRRCGHQAPGRGRERAESGARTRRMPWAMASEHHPAPN